MVRRRLLQLGVVAAVVCASITASPLAAQACGLQDLLDGTCKPEITTDIDGPDVYLHGETPQTPGSNDGGEVEVPPGYVLNPITGIACPPNTPSCISTWGSTTRPIPGLSDIAAFRPSPSVDHMEPNGWFVVGLDANFYATGGAGVVTGELFDYPASVRFTPIRWRWAYGDGTSATKSTRGTTWAAQGIREFDPTPTSHVYTQEGTFYIDLTVGYRAEYSYNDGLWSAITGTLWLPANRLVATVGGAKTVLVQDECDVNPAGPGC